MTHVRRLLAAACTALSLLTGCATGPIELGHPIPTERLAQLKPGTSTLADVLATLGEPQGRGKGLLPGAPPLDLLLYEADRIDGTKMRMQMLMVFVHRASGVYEGYMWFHSGLVMAAGQDGVR
jgi:hypothetical protein